MQQRKQKHIRALDFNKPSSITKSSPEYAISNEVLRKMPDSARPYHVHFIHVEKYSQDPKLKFHTICSLGVLCNGYRKIPQAQRIVDLIVTKVTEYTDLRGTCVVTDGITMYGDESEPDCRKKGHENYDPKTAATEERRGKWLPIFKIPEGEGHFLPVLQGFVQKYFTEYKSEFNNVLF